MFSNLYTAVDKPARLQTVVLDETLFRNGELNLLSTSCISRGSPLRQRWRVVGWVDILLDVISGVERGAGGMSEDHDRCF
jgi:hypothetical protein